jgi:polyhydroxyalkanoate synthesis repressor PhaR
LADTKTPLLIKRYASRRLYNTETSDYVTLDNIAALIREGREVQIIDLKSGDDLTRQYLLQIIADHESKGESVLPLGVLTDLVRSYTTEVQSVVPQFLAMSFEMLRDSQSKMMENVSSPVPSMPAMPNMPSVPGFEAMQAQQKAFLQAMTSGLSAGWPVPGSTGGTGSTSGSDSSASSNKDSELDDIKSQLADLQSKLAAMK